MNAVLQSEPDLFEVVGQVVHENFAAAIEKHGPHLFVVDPGVDLFEVYLDNLPEGQRQYHNCDCCKRFVRRYGSLAVIDSEGRIVPVMWDVSGRAYEIPIYFDAFVAMFKQVARGTIKGVFLDTGAVWGTPEAGGWRHFHVQPKPDLLYRRRDMTANQAMAAKREDFRTLNRALAEFSRDQVAQAVTLLNASALYRSEKVLGPAESLLRLHDQQRVTRRNYAHMVWRAVAEAPAGFCTPRSSMVGTLLDDIKAGMSFDEVKRRFDAKMSPLLYQRPQAAPSAGNIKAAEKLVGKLGIEPALHRRYARLDEIQTIWKPVEEEKPEKGGVFGHLVPKGQFEKRPMRIASAVPMTWEKFRRTVLPDAKKIEFLTWAAMDSYCAIVTASNPDAPPILQWDSEGARNPFSWYLYNNGSPPSHWGLPVREFVNVAAITLKPSMWAGEDKFPHQGKGVVFILDGAKDSRGGVSLALFPEILKSELHQVRSTVEAYSQAGRLEGREEASANGVMVADGGAGNHQFRVTTSTGVVEYTIDRWD